MTCPPHNSGCFLEEEKAKLESKGWTNEEIRYAEDSIIEDKIKQLLK